MLASLFGCVQVNFLYPHQGYAVRFTIWLREVNLNLCVKSTWKSWQMQGQMSAELMSIEMSPGLDDVEKWVGPPQFQIISNSRGRYLKKKNSRGRSGFYSINAAKSWLLVCVAFLMIRWSLPIQVSAQSFLVLATVACLSHKRCPSPSPSINPIPPDIFEA